MFYQYTDLNEFCSLFQIIVAFLVLFGVYLVLLGIALAGLVSALRMRDRSKAERAGDPPAPGGRSVGKTA